MSNFNDQIQSAVEGWITGVTDLFTGTEVDPGAVVAGVLDHIRGYDKYPQTEAQWKAFNKADQEAYGKMSYPEKQAYSMLRLAMGKFEAELHKQNKTFWNAVLSAVYKIGVAAIIAAVAKAETTTPATA